MISRLFLSGVLVAAMAITASAQGRGGGGGGSRNGGGGMAPSMGPARMNRLDVLTNYLKLSKDQRKDLKSIMDEGQKEAGPLRDQMVKGRGEIAVAVQSGKPEAVDPAVKSYADLETKMTAIEMKAFADLYKMLDSDQRGKSRLVFMMMNGVFKGKNWTEVEP